MLTALDVEEWDVNSIGTCASELKYKIDAAPTVALSKTGSDDLQVVF